MKNNIELVGRKEEKEILEEALHSPSSELIAIYGRRRIGKTFLIRKYYSNEICFELSGALNMAMPQQLENFFNVLKTCKRSHKISRPSGWTEAFTQLANYLHSIKTQKKKVVFFDELPWLDSMHSGFLSAFDYFWNSWASKRRDIVVVICGSSASWMINKIIYNKGGLHNRVTKQIRLLPFTLSETKEFLRSRNINLDDYQLATLYMIMGGVPLYLEALQRGKSAIQNIDKICFSSQGLLHDEFNKLYNSLYDDSQMHVSVIRVLAAKRMGLTRNEIIKVAKLKSGGYTTSILNELTESGFISAYTPLNNKTKDTVYRLTDEYSLFYLRFIEESKTKQKGSWSMIANTPRWTSWSGYAFENLCLKHVGKIKKALGIGSIYTEESAWYSKKEKAQIDLLMYRADKCINVCEMKFSNSDFEITKKYTGELQHKVKAYRSSSKTKNTIFTTIVTTHGLKKNDNATRYVDSVVLLKDLF